MFILYSVIHSIIIIRISKSIFVKRHKVAASEALAAVGYVC